MDTAKETRLIFVRHGQSEANVKGIFGGSECDFPLTELGYKQAEIMSEYVLKKYKIEAVYSSDLSRAVNTAKKVAQVLCLKINTDKRLREIDGGIWNGMKYNDISAQYKDEFELWKEDLSKVRAPEGETVYDIQKRALAAINDIAEIEEGKTVLIATHRVLLRTVQCKWENRSLSDIKNCEWLSNCSVSEVLFSNGNLIPINIGQDDFMGDYITRVNGHDSGDIKKHTLWLNCDFFTPITKELIPDGRILSVKGSAFDFTKPKAIGIDKNDEQIIFGMGLDHNFAINGRGIRKFAVLEGDKTGIKMECYTDRPAVQLYTGNEIEDLPEGKDGAVYKNHQGVCLETQVFPNFTKYSHFPDGYLKKGEKYDVVTKYVFSK